MADIESSNPISDNTDDIIEAGIESIDSANTPLPNSILFLCSQNAVRSPMAAGIMKKYFGHKISIDSAGISPKDIDGYAVSVMNEINIDISQHISLSIEPAYIASFDAVVCFSQSAKHLAENICRTVATECQYWPVYDPVNQAENRADQLIHYRKLRDQLLEMLKTKFASE
ncbi:MAG: low molecular weight phosphatase family protein [Rhizobiales bacterium]|nr:low molecular weight phosphatase family protein [Hyphomicrobiales bacterium]NRB15412.1 low molecular weight phosphatase family protein [Hyphomicrobiales bacterium]